MPDLEALADLVIDEVATLRRAAKPDRMAAAP
jgi:hypothetical protein